MRSFFWWQQAVYSAFRLPHVFRRARLSKQTRNCLSYPRSVQPQSVHREADVCSVVFQAV